MAVWDDLNERQRAYLLTIYHLDQAEEAPNAPPGYVASGLAILRSGAGCSMVSMTMDYRRSSAGCLTMAWEIKARAAPSRRCDRADWC